MKHKSIYVLLMIAVFAVVSLGGCGGSSNSFSGGGGTNTTPSMSEVWQDEEAAEEVVGRLNSGDALLLATVKMEAIEKKSDGSVTMKYYDMFNSVFHDADNPEVPYNAAEVLARYNSGDVIVLMNADLDLVNSVRADLGLVSEDAGNFGESGILEAYAISCLKVNGLKNKFIYIVPAFGDMLDSDDAETASQNLETNDNPEDLPTTQNTSPDKAEIIAEPYTLRDLQIDRWAHFLKWMGNIGVMALGNSEQASAYTVMAAANSDLTSIAEAQNYTFNFSYSSFNSSAKFDDYTFTFSRCRNSYVNITIYSAHSFTSGKDYYLVESNTSTIPKNFRDTYVEFEADGHDYYRNVLYGYTKSAATEFNIDGGGMGTGDVSLIRNAPASLNPETSYSSSIEWGINGSVGASKDGPSAEVGGSVSFSKSKSWSVAEYSLINDCFAEHPASAKWYIDVRQPNGGSTNNYVRPFVYWDGVNAVGSSTREIGYETYFMWEVGTNYWKNHPNMSLRVKFNVEDGLCGGWCRNFYAHFNRWDTSYSWEKKQSLKLEQPLHTGVSRAHIAITAHSSDQESFIIYAEDSWTIKNIPSWLRLTDTSGSATGGKGKLIIFDVDANTTGSPRSATITISSGRDNVEVQIAQSRNN
ncbi:MAG: hypothetical protein II954_11055 [Synergistaceae bacterium]|nr:hypothetical protein [Synergistaceae bacterium]